MLPEIPREPLVSYSLRMVSEVTQAASMGLAPRWGGVPFPIHNYGIDTIRAEVSGALYLHLLHTD